MDHYTAKNQHINTTNKSIYTVIPHELISFHLRFKSIIARVLLGANRWR
ncbi:hypothetical protein Patl1_05657 [Pistacia atlantica]|uniref:Uncharacterized protein n=1 Tax=Pistacia atlantica TaxID=434234 RepID=A0ACC1BWL4_9ROSI|nr:hypothetical protein Patl1_05657 [Pistacia atlantica]